MVGYFLLQALENALPGQQVASLICQTLVHADDKAFRHPTKFIGPVYDETEGKRLARLWGWEVRQDGVSWRRVVPSPEPQSLVEMATIRTLVGDAVVVICAGGGGIPVCRDGEGHIRGVEAVIDKDLTAALLARDLGADALLLLTDVDAVEIGFGTDAARPIRHTSPAAMRAESFPAGSMGPKVDAACRFVEATGRPAMIGRLEDAAELLSGAKGTVIEPATMEVVAHPS
jgi:carbamate kinase